MTIGGVGGEGTDINDRYLGLGEAYHTLPTPKVSNWEVPEGAGLLLIEEVDASLAIFICAYTNYSYYYKLNNQVIYVMKVVHVLWGYKMENIFIYLNITD